MASILVVDDARSVRAMVSGALRAAGHDVVEAANGVEGLRLSTTRRFDAIVSDLNMPEMDGIKMTQIIRSRREYAEIPILMLTTEGRTDLVKRGKAVGATGWIVKPFNSGKLLAALELLLARQRTAERCRQAS